jgi:ATP-binding cassette, subfamily C, bacterial CydD
MDKKVRAMRKTLPGERPPRLFLAGVASLDLLSTGATIAQMVFLSQIVAGVIFAQQHLAQVIPQLLLLLGAMAAHAGLVWAREFVVQQGAIRYKSALRQRVFAHLLRLGPAYS